MSGERVDPDYVSDEDRDLHVDEITELEEAGLIVPDVIPAGYSFNDYVDITSNLVGNADVDTLVSDLFSTAESDSIVITPSSFAIMTSYGDMNCSNEGFGLFYDRLAGLVNLAWVGSIIQYFIDLFDNEAATYLYYHLKSLITGNATVLGYLTGAGFYILLDEKPSAAATVCNVFGVINVAFSWIYDFTDEEMLPDTTSNAITYEADSITTDQDP